MQLSGEIIEFRVGNHVVQQCTTSYNAIISEIDNEVPQALKHKAHVILKRQLTEREAQRLVKCYLKRCENAKNGNFESVKPEKPACPQNLLPLR